MGLTETLKLAAATLRDAGVPFALAGSTALSPGALPLPLPVTRAGVTPRAEVPPAACRSAGRRAIEGFLTHSQMCHEGP